MSARVNVSATPNPNSVKVTVDRPVVERGSRTFDSAAEAAVHPLAAALFRLSGVARVFMLGDFITVTKTPEADWKALIPEIERAVLSHFGS
jgi:hypothetical protein